RTWVLKHENRFGPQPIWQAKHQVFSYSDEQNNFFVQYCGQPADLLWWGDLLEHRLFQVFSKEDAHDDEYGKRFRLARTLGFTSGCVTSRAGILYISDK